MRPARLKHPAVLASLAAGTVFSVSILNHLCRGSNVSLTGVSSPLPLRLVAGDDAAAVNGSAEFTDSEPSGRPWESFTRPSDDKLRSMLTPLQYSVTQQDDTERPFTNKYAKNKDAGIYVDIVSGEPLFSSRDKYESGTGWPSFVKPIDNRFIATKVDRKLFSTRTEVRSVIADSHLGHVFDDGPRDRGGKRYCMNSASMEFIPVSEMEARGYGEYLPMVQSDQE